MGQTHAYSFEKLADQFIKYVEVYYFHHPIFLLTGCFHSLNPFYYLLNRNNSMMTGKFWQKLQNLGDFFSPLSISFLGFIPSLGFTRFISYLCLLIDYYETFFMMAISFRAACANEAIRVRAREITVSFSQCC